MAVVVFPQYGHRCRTRYLNKPVPMPGAGPDFFLPANGIGPINWSNMA
jgi:hypothetical protein